MPNNFKLIGDYYVSKAGNDSWDGLTPDTPKRTVQAGLSLVGSANKILVIGAGYYNEVLSRIFGGGTTNCYIIGDGNVVINNPNAYIAHNFSAGSAGNPQINWLNITFTGGPLSYLATNSNAVYLSFTDCKFIGTEITGGQPAGTFVGGLDGIIANRCIFVNTKLTFSRNQGNSFFSSCVFFNCYMFPTILGWYPISTIVNSYIDSFSTVAMTAGTTAANFNYNNIQGAIIMNVASTVTSGVIQDTYGRYYDLSIATSTGDGTIGNKYGRPYTNGAAFNFTDHRTAYPTFNASSSAVDPGFNNILKQDFSLRSTSPMIGRASDFISNIGGTQVATRVDASGSLFSGSNATVDSLVFAPFSDYVISGSAVTGSVTSAPIFVSSSAKVIQEIDYNGLLAFNKDTTAPTGSNVNVPDVLTYTSASAQAGANPDRLTYYMRWTTGSSQPISDAQWENGGLWPAGSFNVFEWNTKPAVDFLGRGNGDQNFSIVNTPTFVRATWIQLRLSLRNDYLI